MRGVFRLVWLVLLTALAAAAAIGADQPYIQIRSEVDRSAVWVGDRFHYVITVIHDPQVRFVTDNLQKSTLNLQPFELLNLAFHEEAGAAGRKKLEISLLLTTYEVQTGDLQIPSFNLFYFVDSAATIPNAERPAETLVIPATLLALRSTVPENASNIRDSIPASAKPLRYRVALPLSMLMLAFAALLLAPVLFHGKRLHATQEIVRRRKQAQAQLCAAAVSFLGRPIDSEAKIEEYYDDLHKILRDYLSAVSVAPTEGRTPRELAAMIPSSYGDALQAESLRDVVALLDSCERVRYSPNAYVVGTEQHGKVVERLRAFAG